MVKYAVYSGFSGELIGIYKELDFAVEQAKRYYGYYEEV